MNSQEKINIDENYITIFEYGKVYYFLQHSFIGYKTKVKRCGFRDTFVFKIKLFFQNKTISRKFYYRHIFNNSKKSDQAKFDLYEEFNIKMEEFCENHLPVLLDKQIAQGYVDFEILMLDSEDIIETEYIVEMLKELGVENDNISDK